LFHAKQAISFSVFVLPPHLLYEVQRPQALTSGKIKCVLPVPQTAGAKDSLGEEISYDRVSDEVTPDVFALIQDTSLDIVAQLGRDKFTHKIVVVIDGGGA